MSRPNILGSRHRSAGFTLVEISIVIIIIGIILGAVIKGKDLVRSGDQKKLFNGFINDWMVTYQNYYDRTGWILGDIANDTNAPDANNLRDGSVADGITEENILNQLRTVGLLTPPLGATGSTMQRRYSSADGTQYTIMLTFTSAGSFGNVIRLQAKQGAATSAIPTDLGIALDRIIDGEANGQAGNFLYVENVAGGAGTTPTVANWPAAFETGPVTKVNVALGPDAGAAAVLHLNL